MANHPLGGNKLGMRRRQAGERREEEEEAEQSVPAWAAPLQAIAIILVTMGPCDSCKMLQNDCHQSN